MPLADSIQALRDRVLADLIAAHDYHQETEVAWRTLGADIDAGRVFTIQNPITGTVTTQADLRDKVDRYINEQLAEATFQQFLSIFEHFFFDLLRLWLLAYPQSLIGKKVDYKDVLDAADKEAITLLVVNKELNEVLYERPTGWFAYLDGKVKLGCPSENEIERLAEAKASRDVLVHNRGVASKTYISKAGRLVRFREGDRIDVPEPYHRETWELLRKVVADVCNAAIAKLTTPP